MRGFFFELNESLADSQYARLDKIKRLEKSKAVLLSARLLSDNAVLRQVFLLLFFDGSDADRDQSVSF